MKEEMSSLAYKSFNTHKNLTVHNLFTNHNFSDVTLVSDNQIPFRAHRCILSASSPVMKNLLLDYPHSNPLIYLRGVNQQDLESVLQFIYLGETKIAKNRTDTFLEIAKDFQLKDFSQDFVPERSNPCSKDDYKNIENDLQPSLLT